MAQRVGIYSGTFDPLHEGHALFIDVSIEQFGLDQVLVIPESKPRYKQNVTPLKHRLEMARLGTRDSLKPTTVVNTNDLPQHTIHGLIGKVHRLHPDDEYYIILGADVFQYAHTWGQRDDEDGSIADIADHVGFIVGIENMSQLAGMKAEGEKLGLNVRFIEVPLAGMSSRRVRENLSQDNHAHGLHDAVYQYITDNSLYGAQ